MTQTAIALCGCALLRSSAPDTPVGPPLLVCGPPQEHDFSQDPVTPARQAVSLIARDRKITHDELWHLYTTLGLDKRAPREATPVAAPLTLEQIRSRQPAEPFHVNSESDSSLAVHYPRIDNPTMTSFQINGDTLINQASKTDKDFVNFHLTLVDGTQHSVLVSREQMEQVQEQIKATAQAAGLCDVTLEVKNSLGLDAGASIDDNGTGFIALSPDMLIASTAIRSAALAHESGHLWQRDADPAAYEPGKLGRIDGNGLYPGKQATEKVADRFSILINPNNIEGNMEIYIGTGLRNREAFLARLAHLESPEFIASDPRHPPVLDRLKSMILIADVVWNDPNPPHISHDGAPRKSAANSGHASP